MVGKMLGSEICHILCQMLAPSMRLLRIVQVHIGWLQGK